MFTAQEAARSALAAGLCVLPPKDDGSKRPDVPSWAAYQSRRSTVTEIDSWYAGGRTGVGVVCGAVSGGLEMLEFEGRAVDAGLPARYRELAEAAGLGELLTRVLNGYMETTPSGGYHVLYRVPTPLGNTRLAAQPDGLVLVETRGEGGYCVTAPSNGHVHPSGGCWQIVTGGFDSIATITDAERDELWRLVRTLDATPEEPPRPPPATGDGNRPGDRYNAAPDAQDRVLELLLAHGWTKVFARGGTVYLRRPGKDRGVSASLGHVAPGVLRVFSTSTAFEARAHAPFGVYATLEHGGDFAAAAAALNDDDGATYTTGGAPVIEFLRLPPEDVTPAPPRLLSPLICDSRTLWFGAQATGKGVLVVFAIAALADADSAFIPGSSIARAIRVGVLDWEDNQDEWAERLHRVGVPARSVPYLSPSGPLTNPRVLANVRAWVGGEGVELVAVDSVIPAAGGADAMKPEAPTAYYQALRALERPSLSLAHVPKDKAQATHPFGSTYWSTPSRLVWRVENVGEGTGEHVVRLVNTKHSRWAWATELMLRVGWSEPGPLRLRSAQNLTLEKDAAPLIDRIVLALRVAGQPLSADELAARVDASAQSVRETVRRHPHRVTDDGRRPAAFSPAVPK